jgi:hypothetical protein
MPYFIKKIDNGFKVCMDNEPKRCFSKNPLPKSRAEKQMRAIGMSGGNKDKKLLEIFKGTGSVGKVAVKMGFDVISIDFDPIYTPHIETDILDWDYKKYHKENNYIPDFIWASPPCNTFSPLAYPLRERNIKNANPKSERAKTGTKILHKTLEIIQYFLKLNPNLKFTIENPKGMMRCDSKMKKLHMETTLYCLYGDIKRKATDFWSNFEMNLKPTDTKYNKDNIISVVDLPINKRYSIPPKLIKQILKMSSEKNNSLEGKGINDFIHCVQKNVYPPLNYNIISKHIIKSL